MFFKEKVPVDLGETKISNIFIDIFMPMANGIYVMVYLLGYRYACEKIENINNKTIASNLNVPLSDVLSSWDFWEKKSIIKKHRESNEEGDYSIEFLDLSKLYLENMTPASSNSSYVSTTTLIESVENENIRQMFSNINYIARRDVTPNEKMKVLKLMEKYNLPAKVIEFAYDYAFDNKNTTHINFIESLLIDWYEKKLDTYEKLEEYFASKSKRFASYKEIYKKIGVFNTLPSDKAKALMNHWLDDLSFDLDMILKACEIASETLSPKTPNLKYINGILEDWNKNNIRNLEDVLKEQVLWDIKKEENQKLKENNINKKNTYKTKSTKSTKFHNFKQRTDEYSSLDLKNIVLKRNKK